MDREAEGKKVASQPADGASQGDRGPRGSEGGRREGSANDRDAGAAVDEKVDEQVEESFPASDPPPGPRAPGSSH